MTWPELGWEKVTEVTEETVEELSVCANCGPIALYLYFEWGKRTRRRLFVDNYGEIHWLPSLAWPEPPILENYVRS